MSLKLRCTVLNSEGEYAYVLHQEGEDPVLWMKKEPSMTARGFKSKKEAQEAGIAFLKAAVALKDPDATVKVHQPN